MNEGYYWNLSIPVGFVDYDDGLLIKDSKNTNPSLAANVTIPSVINSSGTHYNVVGKINGFQDPDKLVIISGHYDTVMCSGFCDNGAGTAGIVELAKVFSEAVQSGVYQPNHTLLFVGFAGEELYLVGSASYIKQHKNDMANITAVINLDCIGSDDLYVSQTPDSGLAQTIIQAAQDLNVSIAVESPGGSDHESFRSPSDVNYMIQLNWGVDLGISDAAPVAASAMLDSYPLFYNDLWNMGAPGWIHTSYDNSTSTSTLNWVEKDDLENHIRVAVLSVMRSSPNFVPEFPPGIALVLLMSVTLTVCVLVRKVRGSRIERSARASTSNLRRKILKGVWARSARASVLLNSGN
jgi:Zn-dependent M28 family amino/carboxypeptidase